MQIREPLFTTIGHPVEEAPDFKDIVSFRRYFVRRTVTETRTWYEFRRREIRHKVWHNERLLFTVMVPRNG